ncbi:hypothetical protein D3C80_1558380 [compost metagenome]
MSVASADVQEGHIPFGQLWKVALNEQWHQHPLGRPFHEDGSIREEQISVLNLEVTLGERSSLDVITESVAQIDDIRARPGSSASARQPFHIAELGKAVAVR